MLLLNLLADWYLMILDLVCSKSLKVLQLNNQFGLLGLSVPSLPQLMLSLLLQSVKFYRGRLLIMLWFVNYQNNYYICKKKKWNIILNPISKFLLQLLYPTKKRSFFGNVIYTPIKKGICLYV